ncbi:MAG: DUF5615 family PIN-like protein [Acidimicrobiia bacterium]
MRFLVDANLSPTVARALRTAGYEARHVADLQLLRASDDEIFERAAIEGDVVITADSDFAMLLALRRATNPSVVLLRGVAELQPAAHIALLLANLAALEEALTAGAIASLGPDRIRLRELPIR